MELFEKVGVLVLTLAVWFVVDILLIPTFLTPYIMKATVPCYDCLYNHASPRLKAKIDAREQQVAETEIKRFDKQFKKLLGYYSSKETSWYSREPRPI